MNAPFFVILMLFSATLIKSPPSDLMSLLDAKATLTELVPKIDEASLIALATNAKADPPTAEQLKKAAAELGDANFRTRKAAATFLMSGGEDAVPTLRALLKAEDPEVSVTARTLLKEMAAKRRAEEANDSAYATRLLAIKHLGTFDSKETETVLATLADTGDFGVSQAARDALHHVRGTAPERPTGLETLEKSLPYLTSNPGFVGMLDLERGSGIAPLLSLLKKDQRPKVQQLMAGGMPEQFSQGLSVALNTVGNVRIDSITFIASNDLAENSGHIAILFKGLYDVNRWDRLLQEELRGNRIVKDGVRIFHGRHDPSFALVDSNTFVFAAGPDWRDSSHFVRLLKDMATEKKPAKVAVDAFEAMKTGGHRLTAAGSFSKEQRAFFNAVMKEEIDRLEPKKRADRQLERLFLQLMLAAINVDNMRGTFSDAGIVKIWGDCKDQAQAKKLSTISTSMHKFLHNLVMENMNGIPPGVLGKFDADTQLWNSAVDDKQVRLSSPALRLVDVLQMMPMLMQQQRARERKAEREVPAAKPLEPPLKQPLKPKAVDPKVPSVVPAKPVPANPVPVPRLVPPKVVPAVP